jgi:hypothetical protein
VLKALVLPLIFCALTAVSATAPPRPPSASAPSVDRLSSDDLRLLAGDSAYSRSARRRYASYLRLQLLELRLRRLERVRAVIEQRLDVNRLLQMP